MSASHQKQLPNPSVVLSEKNRSYGDLATFFESVQPVEAVKVQGV